MQFRRFEFLAPQLNVMENNNSLSNVSLEEALKRKQRLLALKGRSAIKRKEDDSSVSGEKEQLPKPVFRSYKPQDENLKEHSLPKIKPPNLEDHVQEELEATKSKPVIEGLDLSNLAPRKPDWDLKRDVAKKLEKLEKQTQRAIAELIRARLKQDIEDLVAAVNMGAKANEDAKFEED